MINQIIISLEDVGKRLDAFVVEKFPDFSRSHVKNLIEKGLIKLDGKVPTKAGILLKVGQKVEIEPQEPQKISTEAEDIEFEIVFQDKDLVVVNKPQGLVVHPCASTKSGTLVNGLLNKITDLSGINGELRPGIVHRLDKDTSGLMVVAKNDLAHVDLAEQIKNKICHRNYLAVLEGHLKDSEGRVETYIKRDPKDRKKMSVQASGRLAITDFKVLKYFDSACLVEFILQTGRTHQIRVHAKHLGHPVIGDRLYGKEKKELLGQLLHAYKLSFYHPRTKEFIEFEAELPDYFKGYLNKLEK